MQARSPLPAVSTDQPDTPGVHGQALGYMPQISSLQHQLQQEELLREVQI